MVWVAVVTKPGQERRAKANLEQQAADFGTGFEVYLPLKLAQARGRVPLIIATPFIPRYLFARIDLGTQSWKRIWYTPGVHSLLGGNEQPNRAPDYVIERLRAQEDAGFIRLDLHAEKAQGADYQPGAAVRLAGGPLEALFVELVDERRAIILVSLLGRNSHVTVDVSKLRTTGTD